MKVNFTHYYFTWRGPRLSNKLILMQRTSKSEEYCRRQKKRLGGSKVLCKILPLFLFFHLPLLLLLLLNLAFYTLLVFKFSCGISSSRRLQNPTPDDSNSINWRNFKVVIELFVFMGIYWLPEVCCSNFPPKNFLLQSVGFFIHWFDSENWDHPAVTFFQHLNQVQITSLLYLSFDCPLEALLSC